MLRKNFLFCYLQRFNLFVGCWPKFGENIRKSWKAKIRYYLKNKNKTNKESYLLGVFERFGETSRKPRFLLDSLPSLQR